MTGISTSVPGPVPAPGPIIAIDGPAAAGKGTLARRIAAGLDLPYLDTGLLYRVVGRMVLDAMADPADAEAAHRAACAVRPEDLDRTDLRGPEADRAASVVAAHANVRAVLLQFQRDFGRARGAVLDGRDVGTVIFPDADAKLFVTASDAARARRRWLEMQRKGRAVALEDVAAEMAERDARDAARTASPLRPAADAVLLDTTELDADAAFVAAIEILMDRLGPRFRLNLAGLSPI